MRSASKSGVGGTVEAFNFIRRVAFPSTGAVLAIFATIVVATSVPSLFLSRESIGQMLVFTGAVFFWPGVVGEIVSSTILLRGDKILDFRRLMGVEIISAVTMGGFLLLFSIAGAVSGMSHLWVDGFLVGLAVSLPLRFLTSVAMSAAQVWRKLASGFPTALLTTFSFLILSPFLSTGSSLSVLKTGLLVGSIACLSSVGVLLIVRRVEIEGTAEIHHSPMDLFRSFLDHWLRKTPAALEDRLLTLSTEGSIQTKILTFFGNDALPKASIVVSNFHPGPYRDMGSGGLPSELKMSLEQKQSGIVQVPHGISSHKLNIISHRDIDRLLSAARQNFPSSHPIHEATVMIREREEEAIVSGQAFDKVALLTVTLAPEEMEDLPTEVSVEIEKEASKRGFEVLVIDAHNSLVGQTSITSVQAERIIRAAVRVLERLMNLPQQSFTIGSSSDSLSGFGLNEGIGPGGMSVLALTTGGETFSYITIDGNNMQQGLRDLILQSMRKAGVDDGEIMTTDTHLVTGLVRSPLGYYPVGAGLPAEYLIQKVTETVRKARVEMEDAAAGVSKFSLSLHVLGSEAFNSISSFIGRIARQIGRSFLWLEASALVLSLVIVIAV